MSLAEALLAGPSAPQRRAIAELLLLRIDKMSMGASLEARVPFLDHKVVELALSIPSARPCHRSKRVREVEGLCLRTR